MIPTALTTRGVVFAYLFGPPRVLDRRVGMEIHDAVCKELGVDDFAFKYAAAPAGGDEPPDPSRGFSIQLQRKQGRGAFTITVDNQNIKAPIRFFVQYTWPPTRAHVQEEIDAASDATFRVLGEGFQKVLAEARLRTQVEAHGGDATEFMLNRVLRLNPDALERLEARPTFASMLFETPAGQPGEAESLKDPKREIKIEGLREDSRCLYVEVMSQWPQLAQPPEGALGVDPSMIRKIDKLPSEYIANTEQYLSEHVMRFFETPEEVSDA